MKDKKIGLKPAIKVPNKPELKPIKRDIDIADYLRKGIPIPANVSLQSFKDFRKNILVPHKVEPKNFSLKKSKIQKGTVRGIKFDSKWEWAFYLYQNEIIRNVCVRNTTRFVTYKAADGRKRKFFPDFVVNGLFVEVKGRFRDNDILKQQQHPEIEFYSSTEMKDIIRAVKQRYPNWEDDYKKRL